MDRRAALAASIERELDRCVDEGPEWVWGERDCLLFPANIVRDAIGVDPAEPYRGRYSCAVTAAEVIGPRGLLYVSNHRAKAVGARRVDVSEAEIGDWGVCVIPAGLASVLKYRGGLWIGCRDRGVSFIPETHVRRAWSFC